GPSRAAMTVVADMVDTGQLAVDEQGRVTATGVAAAPPDALRSAALRVLAAGTEPMAAGLLVSRLSAQTEFVGLTDQARAEGLLLPAGRRWAVALVTVPLAVATPLAFYDLWQLVAPNAQGIGFDLLLLLALMLALVPVTMVFSPPRRSPLGEAVLVSAKHVRA